MAFVSVSEQKMEAQWKDSI